MVTANILRYGLDEAVLDRRGMIRTRDGSELDCSGATSVEGIEVGGSEPYGTKRRVAFRVGGAWGVLEPSGTPGTALFVPFLEQGISANSVIDEGNTAGELQAFSSIPDFAGKKVGLAVALCAKLDVSEMPSLSLALKCRNVNDTFVKVLNSPELDFGTVSEISFARVDQASSNGGSVSVKARLTLQDGTVTDWMNVSEIEGRAARKVQYQATLQAETIGASVAVLNSVLTEYTRGIGIISGKGTVEIVSVTRNWNIPLRSLRLRVRHARLKDSVLSCHVAFRDLPKAVVGENVGVGTGETATHQLAHVGGLHHDSLRVYFDGVRQYAGYEFNAEVGRVTCAAPVGAVMTVDYEYGWGMEEWQVMRNNGTVPGLDFNATEFVYALPPGSTPKSICAVKIALETTGGTERGEALGEGAGALRSYPLAHVAKQGSPVVYADGVRLPDTAWGLSLDGTMLRVFASSGAALTADYEWLSETPKVRQFVAVFAE